MTTAPVPALQGVDEVTLFRSLFAANPDAMLLVDSRGTIVLSNPAAQSLLGYSAEELRGLAVDALVPDAIRPRHAAYREAYARNPRPRPMGTQMKLVAKHRDGSEVLVEIALSPLQDQGLPYVVASVRGIGAYPRVQQALQRARYAEHVAQIGRVAVDMRDPQALLEQITQAAVDALHVASSVVFLLETDGLEFQVVSGVGLLPGERVGQREPNRPDSLAGLVLAKGEPIIVDDFATEPRFGVPRSYLDAGLATGLAVPLSDRGRIVGALMVRASDAQRFGEDEVRFLESLSSLLGTSLQRAHTEEQLNHAQRLESVGQLTGGIAHDFNNLLTVISGNLQVLEELPSVMEDALAPQMVAAATRATSRAAELTGKLLAFSRRQVLQPRAVDIGALLRSLTGMLRRAVDQRIAITLDAPFECPQCLADPVQLEAALLNIAINARDAMPEGGALVFSCRPLPVVSPELRNELTDAGNNAYVAIAIADNGSGMSDQVKERAFEPFFTTKGSGRGTGLGLSTVYGFAKQSRGAVVLDSVVGAGTTVTLYLPSVLEVEDGVLDVDVERSLPAGLHVLLVEDDSEVRSVVRRFLIALGCRVTACMNAEQALAMLTPEESFDLILSDIALGGGLRGTDLARHVQQVMPGIPVLLMTGFSSAVVETPPGWEVLRKPYTRAELGRAIARILAKAQ